MFVLPNADDASASTPPLFHTSFTEPLDETKWQGDLSYFKPQTGPEHGMLRLDAPPDLGTAYLATRNPFSAVHWEWYIRQAFAPSNNNRAFVFLTADSGILNENTSGLALRTGENGTPKHFRLMQFDPGGASTELSKSEVQIEADTGYRIRVLLSPNNDIHLYLAEGRFNTPLLQPEIASLPETDEVPAGHFGFRTLYTATRSDQFYFSDVRIADELPAPEIPDVSVSTTADLHYPVNTPWQQLAQGTVITVTFNVPPDSVYITPGLFQLDSGRQPDELHCSHPQICSLLFRDPLSSGEYRLMAGIYSTIYGQQSSPEEIPILVPGKARPGDIVINEFMYRPPAGLPSYVELFNASDKLLNLRNWRLQRRALSSEPERFITNDDLILQPGEFLVLTPDAEALQTMPNATGIYGMNNFPRFNIASSDEIRLISENHEVIDSLQYLPSSWGGFEVALERKSPDVPAWLQLNWAESLSGQGGTPGQPNSVRPPDTPPELLSVDYSGSEAVSMIFSRMLDAESVSAPDNIGLIAFSGDENSAVAPDSPSFTEEGMIVSVTPVLTGPETVTLIPSEPLVHGYFYMIQLQGIQDVFGNIIAFQEKGFRYYDISAALWNDVIINEILYRPDQSHNRRFVEVLNISDHVFDLRNWKLGRSIGNFVSLIDPDFSEPVYLTPGEKIVISEPGLVLSDPETTQNVFHLELQSFPSLSRFGDSVYLISSQNITTDSVSYFPQWGGNRDGVSLERIDPGGASADPSNWREHPNSHSAGRRNYHFEDDPDPVVILHAIKTGDHEIDLHFNRFVRRESLQRATLNGQEISLSMANSPLEYASQFSFHSGDAIQRRFKNVHIATVTDYSGRISTNLEIPLSFRPDPEDLIINEVMYQPISERYSSRPDQSEYVEIFNKSGIPIQMDNLVLHDRPDKNGQVRTLSPENLERTSLPPESYAVFFADTSQLLQETRIHQAFSISEQSAGIFFRVDRQTLGLSSQGDEIYLSDGKTVLDSLWYHPSWHNPNIYDVRGISLERISRDIQTQNRTNWTSSSSLDGGTPGHVNAAAAPAANITHSGLELSPNPFSPDGDGFDDHLIIRYHLDNPDYLMHVRIYDRHGRQVRTLANGLQAGRSGKLIWDGRTDRGLMNRAGLYIIYFEAFNSSENMNKVYKAVAVLAVPL